MRLKRFNQQKEKKNAINRTGLVSFQPFLVCSVDSFLADSLIVSGIEIGKKEARTNIEEN